jgi:hypothetical protein
MIDKTNSLFLSCSALTLMCKLQGFECCVVHAVAVYIHVKYVPCHHCMARPQVVDGGDGLRTWSVAANILNKRSRTADRGWSSSLGIGRRANSPRP